MKNKVRQYRQGDVLVIAVDKIPENLVKTDRVTLALGEVTGHHHTISTGAVGFAEKESNLAEYLSVEAGEAELTHQEHATINVPAGTYQKVIQSEYVAGALKNVAD